MKNVIEVTGTVVLFRKSTSERFELFLRERKKMVNEIGLRFGGIDILERQVKVTFSEFGKATLSEFGYFHAEVLPKLLIAYPLLGTKVLNETMTKNQLKMDCGFYEIVKYFKNKTELVSFPKPKSFSKVGKLEMAEIIEFAKSICVDAGVDVVSSEEYKRINNLE